jgi:cytochrome c oxidase subunit 2
MIPEVASTMAPRVDALYYFLVGLTAFFTILIFALFVGFMVKYKRRDPNSVGARIHGGMVLEIAWSVIPLFIVLGIFVWAAQIFFAFARPPKETMNIYATGKQWMWKFQHLDGQREINQLHVPVGRAVKLIMTSEDVIHDLFVPAFRVKADVVPGRYTNLWFEATKPGTYQLFCAEYCGTKHSGMIGEVVVMEQDQFQAWLSGAVKDGSLAMSGERLFQDLACNTCHREDSTARGPVLNNLYGKTVALQSGGQVVADEAYIRESILMPAAKVTSGFQPTMPAFQGLVSEEGLLQIIEYVKSLGAEHGAQTGHPAADGATAGEHEPARTSPTRN